MSGHPPKCSCPYHYGVREGREQRGAEVLAAILRLRPNIENTDGATDCDDRIMVAVATYMDRLRAELEDL